MGIKMNITGKNGQPKLVDMNRRKAARLKCYDCSAFNWAEVDRCEFTECTLYPYRQGKCPGSSGERNAASGITVPGAALGQPMKYQNALPLIAPCGPFGKLKLTGAARLRRLKAGKLQKWI